MSRVVKNIIFVLVAFAAVLPSCKKASTDSDKISLIGDDEIVLYLDDAIDAVVDTKAVSEVSSIPSNLYWAATSGSGTSETQKFANTYSSVSSSKINTGKYQTATASTYNYYVSNAFLNVGADTYVSASGGTDGTDVICGRVSSSSATPSITMGHIFARTGTLSLSAPSGYTVSGTPSWSIMKSGTNTGTAGTYNLRTGAWSSVSGLASYTSFNSSSDMYLIPGTYSIRVQFTLTRGNFSKEYTQTGSITVAAGNKYNITASTSSAEAVQVVFTTSVTAWTSASTSFNWDGTDSGGGSSDVTTYRLSSVALASSSISTSGTTTATAYRQRYVNGVATGSEEAISASNITWSTGSSSIATVNSSGTVTGVAAGQTPVTATLKSGAPNYSDYQSVYRTNSSTLTVVAPGVVATEYRNPSVSISASPTQIAATGGSSTLSYSASYEYRYKYSDNTYSSWTSTSGTPTITDNGATGFSRSGATVTASANTGSARSIICRANFSIGGQSATQQSVTINQSAASITYRLSSSVSFASSPITVATTTTASVTRQRYVNGTASGSAEAVAASNITWSSSNTGKATVNTSGTVTGVAAGSATITAALKSTAPDYSSYESSYRSATGSITVTAASVVATEYRNPSVSISASPTQLSAAAGGTSTLSYSASYEYRYKYSNNTYSDWTEASSTPTITGSATGFTREGTIVTVQKNTGAARSVVYKANFSIGGQSATEKSVTITQAAPVIVSTEYRNLVVSISSNQTSFTAAGGSATLSYNATYEYRYLYNNGDYSSWTSTSGTPTVTGSATGFTRSGTSVTVASNSGSARSVIYTASFSIGSLSDTKSVTLTQAGADVITYRLLAVTFGSSTIAAGNTTTASVTRQKYVNGVASGSAESVSAANINWSSGSTGVATVNTSGNVTGVGGGSSVITASLKTTAPDYSSYESSYRSNTGTITVLPYLTVSWASNSTPTWVAQRGKLSISGVSGGASISSVSSSNTSAATVSGSGSDYYVETKSSNSYTITVTASNGQTGTLACSAPSWPYPRFSSSSWYVNPDGSTATSTSTGGSVFNGSNMSLYNASSGGTAFTYSTSNGVVVGTELIRDKVSTILNPELELSGSYTSYFTKSINFTSGSFTANLYLNSLPSPGSYTSDISSWLTGQLATVTFRVGGTNGRTVTANVYGVNPFYGWSAYSASVIYEHDYGILSSYVTAPTYASSAVVRTTPNCSSTNYGIALRRNGSWVANNAAIKNAVSVTDYSSTQKRFTWLLNSSALSEHIAGHVDVYAYVQNLYSTERYYSPVLLKRGIYVHGAIGAKMTFNAAQTACTISAEFAGSEASYGFGTPSGAFVSTAHEDGDIYTNRALPSGTVYEVYGYAGLGGDIYTLVNENNNTLAPNKIVKGEAPDFIFRNVGSVGVFVEDADPNLSVYYITKYGQTVTEGGITHGMYVLHLLQGIALSSSTLNAGWLAY